MATTAATSGATRAANRIERRIVLGLGAVIVLCVVAFGLFGPTRDDSDPRPTTFNAGSRGVKAAYLLAGEMGYDARRWESPFGDLARVDAARTTLVLTEPILPVKSLKATQGEIEGFLRRGGRVVATGMSGAALLPGGKTAATTRLYQALCFTRPAGAGELARAGKVSMNGPVRWDASGPEFRVEERCGNDAVVVSYPVGKGEAIWWSSPMPLTNAGIREDASLALVLASLGPAKAGDERRVVLFDEFLHEQRESIGDTLAGLPWWALGGQLATVVLLLVLSFGRRSGPLRMPVEVPRTSPVEFAESMGRLYQRANATEAAVEAARGQMMRFLAESCGLSHEALRREPTEIAGALEAKFGGEWGVLGDHLAAAQTGAGLVMTGKQALRLVQALEEDQRRLEELVSARISLRSVGG